MLRWHPATWYHSIMAAPRLRQAPTHLWAIMAPEGMCALYGRVYGSMLRLIVIAGPCHERTIAGSPSSAAALMAGTLHMMCAQKEQDDWSYILDMAQRIDGYRTDSAQVLLCLSSHAFATCQAALGCSAMCVAVHRSSAVMPAKLACRYA